MAGFHLFSSKYHCMFTRRSSQGPCTFLPLCQGQLEVISSPWSLISKEWVTCLLLAFPFPVFQTACRLRIQKHWFLEPLENESFSRMLYLLLRPFTETVALLNSISLYLPPPFCASQRVLQSHPCAKTLPWVTLASSGPAAFYNILRSPLPLESFLSQAPSTNSLTPPC